MASKTNTCNPMSIRPINDLIAEAMGNVYNTLFAMFEKYNTHPFVPTLPSILGLFTYKYYTEKIREKCPQIISDHRNLCSKNRIDDMKKYIKKYYSHDKFELFQNSNKIITKEKMYNDLLIIHLKNLSSSLPSFRRLTYMRNLSSNTNITTKLVEDTINEKWDWEKLVKNPAIYQDLEFVDKHIDNFFNYKYQDELFMNPYLTISFVRKHINRDWCWRKLSSNSAFTMDDIGNNPELPWNWIYISCNPNLTFDFISKNLDKEWNWSLICNNRFDVENEQAITKLCKCQHQKLMQNVFMELNTIIFHPDNIEFMKACGLLSGISNY